MGHFGSESVVRLGIDFKSEKPCFSVEFVDTYSIHSFPPPSRRPQQIQGVQRSGAGVSPLKAYRGRHLCDFGHQTFRWTQGSRV